MSQHEGTPPGWYHGQGDPPGTERWWDGASWVGGPQATGNPAPAGSPPTGYGPPPGYGYQMPGYGMPSYGYGAPTVGAPPYGYGVPGYGPPRYAGWWRRVGATVLDSMIIGIPAQIVGTVVLNALPRNDRGTCINNAGRRYACDQFTFGWVLMIALMYVVFAVVVFTFYYVRPMTRSGQTLGKRIVEIRVVRFQERVPLTYGRVIGRYFAAVLSALPCYLGFLWPLWDEHKQTFHDKICDTIVVFDG